MDIGDGADSTSDFFAREAMEFAQNGIQAFCGRQLHDGLDFNQHSVSYVQPEEAEGCSCFHPEDHLDGLTFDVSSSVVKKFLYVLAHQDLDQSAFVQTHLDQLLQFEDYTTLIERAGILFEVDKPFDVMEQLNLVRHYVVFLVRGVEANTDSLGDDIDLMLSEFVKFVKTHGVPAIADSSDDSEADVLADPFSDDFGSDDVGAVSSFSVTADAFDINLPSDSGSEIDISLSEEDDVEGGDVDFS
jgi:hypothetical protein